MQTLTSVGFYLPGQHRKELLASIRFAVEGFGVPLMMDATQLSVLLDDIDNALPTHIAESANAITVSRKNLYVSLSPTLAIIWVIAPAPNKPWRDATNSRFLSALTPTAVRCLRSGSGAIARVSPHVFGIKRWLHCYARNPGAWRVENNPTLSPIAETSSTESEQVFSLRDNVLARKLFLIKRVSGLVV
ncbi:MAG: hypothetical protein AAF662_08640 [Pseudomonadota bacterium]